MWWEYLVLLVLLSLSIIFIVRYFIRKMKNSECDDNECEGCALKNNVNCCSR